MPGIYKLLCCLALVLFGIHDVSAQKATDKGEIFEKINAEGLKALGEGNFTKALECFTRAEAYAEENGLTVPNVISKMNLGKTYSDIHCLGDALTYYLQALEIVNKTPGQQSLRLALLINIGTLYNAEGELRLGLDYNLKAYNFAKEDGSCNSCIVIGAINLSDIYTKLNDQKTARKYLEEVRHLKMNKSEYQLWRINYAETYFKDGRIADAENIVQEVLKNIEIDSDNNCYQCIVKLLAEMREGTGNIKEAIHFAVQGLKRSRSIKDTAEMYELLAGIYYKDKQYEKAFKYKDSLATARDSMSRIINNGLYATNKVKLKIQDYQNEARYNLEKRESERNLFILVIAMGIVIFYFIFRNLRARVVKQRQQSIISDNKQRIYELELDKLTNDAAEKNRKLSAKALYLSGRNELIGEVIKALDDIPEIRQANVHGHIKTLRQHLKADDEWDSFITYFEQVNPDFLRLLQEKHPQLNPADIRFICYLYMNMDMKDISSVFSVTLEAARKRRQRIAKKMEVDPDDLDEYIASLR